MAENKGKKPAGQTAGKNKSAAAGKCAAQGTKAARTAPPRAPNKSKTPQKNSTRPASSPKGQERQGIIKRLIETHKRVIGHKKGERDEVRYNNKERHKNWVFKEEGENVSALGLTHSGETFGGKNMPLKENPDKKDKTPAYIRHGVIRGKKSSFSTKGKV